MFHRGDGGIERMRGEEIAFIKQMGVHEKVDVLKASGKHRR